MHAQIALIVSSIAFCVGGIYLKRYADTGDALPLTISFAFYLVGNLVFARVLAHGLGAGMAMASMLQLGLMMTAGILLFGEKLTMSQLAGLACAMMAIWLFSQEPPNPPEARQRSATKVTGSISTQ